MMPLLHKYHTWKVLSWSAVILSTCFVQTGIHYCHNHHVSGRMFASLALLPPLFPRVTRIELRYIAISCPRHYWWNCYPQSNTNLIPIYWTSFVLVSVGGAAKIAIAAIGIRFVAVFHIATMIVSHWSTIGAFLANNFDLEAIPSPRSASICGRRRKGPMETDEGFRKARKSCYPITTTVTKKAIDQLEKRIGSIRLW